MKLTSIAAVDKNYSIGNNGKIPWSIPEESKHFYQTTVGNPVIMGRKTFENILKVNNGPLEDRTNIVLSSKDYFDDHNVVTVRDIKTAIACGIDYASNDEVFVAGGDSVYEQFMNEVDRLLISWIDQNNEGNHKFPPIMKDEWDIDYRTQKNKFTIISYERSR